MKHKLIYLLFFLSCTQTKKIEKYNDKVNTALDTFTHKVLNRALLNPQSLINVGGWNAWVHLPDDYTTTTKSYPTIIFFPGTGEVGTNASLVIANGPGAYLTQEWDGNADTSKFIVISLQPSSTWQVESTIQGKINTLKSLYRIDPKRLHLTGLSMGGWESTTFVTGDAYGGSTYAGQIASVVEVEGVKPDDNAPYPNLFDNFAKAGGRLLGFEQKLDSRDILTRVNRMNATKPGSAIFVSTNFGGGGHCCWNEFYGGQGKQPGKFMLDGVSQNIYEWMAKQKLGTAPPTIPPPPITPPPPVTPPPPPVIPPPVQTGTRKTINKGSDGGIWFINNGSIVAGDTVDIKAGVYNYISFSGLVGTAVKPIVIMNSGGQVIARGLNQVDTAMYCFRAVNSQYFKFTGTGTPGLFYGFKAGGQNKMGGSGVNFKENTTDWEVDHVECQNVVNGFLSKIDPYDCLPESYSTGWTMKNISIHDCYVHKTQGEGLYIINTASTVDVLDCYNKTITVEPVMGNNIKIYNMTVDSTGWDGIQLAASPNSEIYNCKVSNYGMENKGSQQAGILFGGKTSGSVHDNVVKGGTGNGMQIFGQALTHIYNNTVIDAGWDNTSQRQDAIIIDDRPQPGTKYSGLQVNFHNNTIINSGRNNLRIYNSYSTMAQGSIIKANVFIQPNGTSQYEDKYLNTNSNLNIDTTGNLRYAKISDTSGIPVIPPPVPLTLISFTATKGTNITLSWHTANEFNLKNFEIEQSTDAVNFTSVASVNAKNQSDNLYTATVTATVTTYYRLKMINTDGTFTYSFVVPVAFTPLPSVVSTSISGNNALILSPTAQTAIWRVYDTKGNRIKNGTVKLIAGQTSLVLPVLGAGTYYFMLIATQEITWTKFVK